MRTLSRLLVAVLLVAAGAAAQAAVNDVGVPAAGGAPLSLGVPPGPEACPPAGVVSAAFTGTTTQLGRIFRDAIASACPSKVYPGIFNASTTYNYESYTYDNTSAATACVTVNFDPNTGPGTVCGTNAHMSAYLGSYNPASQATNFVGDVGSSVTQPFSFDVPATSSVVLVVTNTASQAVCGYSFEVLNLPCAVDADLSLTKTASAASVPPGSNVTFTLTVANAGPSAASAVVVTDSLPAGLTYVSNTCGATFAAPTLTWTVGTLANGANASCNVVATVSTGGAFVNSATVASQATDPVPANNTGTVTVTGQLSVLEIPTLGGIGLVALFLGLAVASLVLLRRRRAA